MEKETLIERVTAHLNNYPEDWTQVDHGLKHASGVKVSYKRLFGVFPHATISIGGHHVTVTDKKTRKEFVKAYRRVQHLLEIEREKESVDAIGKVFFSTANMKCTDIARKKVNGDI